jgi:hypothetical protein
MKKISQFLFVLFCISQSNFVFATEDMPKTRDLMQNFESTADHQKFQALRADFKASQEVTKACLSCHNQAAKQIHKDIHWTWDVKNDGQELGKKVSINNF